MDKNTKRILKKVEQIMNAAEELTSEMLCQEIEKKLKKITVDIPSLWFSDQMGTMTMMDDSCPRWEDDAVRFAFDYIFYEWKENNYPEMYIDEEDETEVKKATAKIVKKHGKTIYEIIVLSRGLDRTNRCYGHFGLVKKVK